MRDRKYLDWLREQDCCVSGVDAPSEPAHVFKSINGGGMGLKSDDRAALPLSHNEHQKQHSIGEISYWRNRLNNDDALLKKAVSALAHVYYHTYLTEKP